MATDVGERAHDMIVTAHDDDACAEKVEAAPVAGRRNLIFVTDDLRTGAQKRRLLRLEKRLVVIEPSGQAHIAYSVDVDDIRLGRIHSINV